MAEPDTLPPLRPDLRVLQIVSGDLWGGAEAMACNLITRLRDDWGVTLRTIALNRGHLADRLAGAGIPVQVIDERRYSFGEILSRAAKAIAEFQPDLVHSHRYKENILALLARGARGRPRLVATQHGLPELGNNPSIFRRTLHWGHYRLMARYFSKVVAVSGDLGRFMIEEAGLPGEQVEVIHNGIEIPQVPAADRRPGSPFVVGSCGRLVEVKDYALLCRVAAAAGDGIRFRIAGDGPQRPLLESLAQQHGLGDRLQLQGECRNMESFYSGIDLYLNTSRHEGIPLTVLEALSRGIPVIAPAVGGLVEIFRDGVEGYLVPDREPASFARRCRGILEDRKLWEQMSRAARIRAQTGFSACTMAGNYYRLYRRIIA